MDAHAAASSLLDAHRSGAAALPFSAALKPASLEDAYAIQDLVATARGPIGGWKVGPHGKDTFSCAPVPASLIKGSGAGFDRKNCRELGVEVELAFIIGQDLPPRNKPYERTEVVAAIAAFTPLIEVIATRFADSSTLSVFENLADGIRNAAFILGEPVKDWHTIDMTRGGIELVIDGAVRQSIAANPSRDPIRLVTWLATHVAARCGGLRAGQVVTTGALDGAASIGSPSRVEARYGDLGNVIVSIT